MSVPRDHYIKIRIDLYPAEGTRTYTQQYIDETIWDEKREEFVPTGKKKPFEQVSPEITISPYREDLKAAVTWFLQITMRMMEHLKEQILSVTA